MAEITEPLLRDAPPWAMEEMIEAEPELVRSILTDPALETVVTKVAAAIRDAGDRPQARIVGCGSSDHAATAIAELIGEAVSATGRDASAVHARQAFEAALDPGNEALLIAVSHEGETAATLAALKSSGTNLRVAITANPGGPIGLASDLVIETPFVDRSWCHTVGYLSSIAVGRRIASALTSRTPDAEAAAERLSAVVGLRPEIAAAARDLANV